MRKNRIYPNGIQILVNHIFTFFIVLVGIITGIVFIIYGYKINNIFLIIAGSFIIIIWSIIVIILDLWNRLLLRVEFKETFLQYNDFVINFYIMHRITEEISLINLISLVVDNKKLTFIYHNGNQKNVELRNFSKKQVKIIIAEILKIACRINGYAAICDLPN